MEEELVEDAVDEEAAALGAEFFGEFDVFVYGDFFGDGGAVLEFGDGHVDEEYVHSGDAFEFPALQPGFDHLVCLVATVECSLEELAGEVEVGDVFLYARVEHDGPGCCFVEVVLVECFEHHEVVLRYLFEVVFPEEAALRDCRDECVAVHEVAEEVDGEFFVLLEVGVWVREVLAVCVLLPEVDEGFAQEVLVCLPASAPVFDVLFELEVVGEAAQVFVVEEFAVWGFFGVCGAEFLFPFFDDAFSDVEHAHEEGYLKDAQFVEFFDVVVEFFEWVCATADLVGVECLEDFAS